MCDLSHFYYKDIPIYLITLIDSESKQIQFLQKHPLVNYIWMKAQLQTHLDFLFSTRVKRGYTIFSRFTDYIFTKEIKVISTIIGNLALLVFYNVAIDFYYISPFILNLICTMQNICGSLTPSQRALRKNYLEINTLICDTFAMFNYSTRIISTDVNAYFGNDAVYSQMCFVNLLKNEFLSIFRNFLGKRKFENAQKEIDYDNEQNKINKENKIKEFEKVKISYRKILAYNKKIKAMRMKKYIGKAVNFQIDNEMEDDVNEQRFFTSMPGNVNMLNENYDIQRGNNNINVNQRFFSTSGNHKANTENIGNSTQEKGNGITFYSDLFGLSLDYMNTQVSNDNSYNKNRGLYSSPNRMEMNRKSSPPIERKDIFGLNDNSNNNNIKEENTKELNLLFNQQLISNINQNVQLMENKDNPKNTNTTTDNIKNKLFNLINPSLDIQQDNIKQNYATNNANVNLFDLNIIDFTKVNQPSTSLSSSNVIEQKPQTILNIPIQYNMKPLLDIPQSKQISNFPNNFYSVPGKTTQYSNFSDVSPSSFQQSTIFNATVDQRNYASVNPYTNMNKGPNINQPMEQLSLSSLRNSSKLPSTSTLPQYTTYDQQFSQDDMSFLSISNSTQTSNREDFLRISKNNPEIVAELKERIYISFKKDNSIALTDSKGYIGIFIRPGFRIGKKSFILNILHTNWSNNPQFYQNKSIELFMRKNNESSYLFEINNMYNPQMKLITYSINQQFLNNMKVFIPQFAWRTNNTINIKINFNDKIIKTNCIYKMILVLYPRLRTSCYITRSNNGIISQGKDGEYSIIYNRSINDVNIEFGGGNIYNQIGKVSIRIEMKDNILSGNEIQVGYFNNPNHQENLNVNHLSMVNYEYEL